MKLSCQPVTFFSAIASGEMSLAELMSFGAEIGLDGIECSPVLVEPLGKVRPAEFRRLAEAAGLVVCSYTSYSDFVHPEPAQREREVAQMLDAVETAKTLGAPVVRALTGQRWPEVAEADGIRFVVDGVRRVAAAAEAAGIKLVVENHTKAFIWQHFDFAMRGEVFLRVMDALRSEPVYVLFDTGNPLVTNEEVLPLFEALRDRIAHVHLNDVQRPGVFDFVPVGTGIAPNAEVLRRLRASGYDGWISFEEASRTGRDGFRQAARFARAAWESAGSGSARTS